MRKLAVMFYSQDEDDLVDDVDFSVAEQRREFWRRHGLQEWASDEKWYRRIRDELSPPPGQSELF